MPLDGGRVLMGHSHYHIGRIGHRVPLDEDKVLTGYSSYHIGRIGHRMPLDGGRLMGHMVPLLQPYR